MELTIHLSEEAARRVADLTNGDPEDHKVVVEALLEQALTTASRRDLAHALVIQARQRAAESNLSQQEWAAQMRDVAERIRQQAIKRGTAIDGDFLTDEDFLVER